MASRRVVLLAATGAVLVAAFAAVSAPRVVFRKSPTVADRRPGDVRRISMAVEDNGILHAVLEVWTDSDWDVEYWSSLEALTPRARVVTNDLVEQREATIGIGFGWLGLAWVDVDEKTGRQTLKATTKRVRDRDWLPPRTVIASDERIEVDSAGSARGRAPLVGYRIGRQAFHWVGLGTAIPSAVLSAPDARALPSGVAATASFRDGTWTAYLRARSSRVIFREAEVRYAGAPGAHRRGEVVPVVALTRAHA